MITLAIEVTTETPEAKNDPLQDGFVSLGTVGRTPCNSDGSYDGQYGDGRRYEYVTTPTIEKITY